MLQFRHHKRKRTPVVFQRPVQRSVRLSRCGPPSRGRFEFLASLVSS